MSHQKTCCLFRVLAVASPLEVSLHAHMQDHVVPSIEWTEPSLASALAAVSQGRIVAEAWTAGWVKERYEEYLTTSAIIGRRKEVRELDSAVQTGLGNMGQSLEVLDDLAKYLVGKEILMATALLESHHAMVSAAYSNVRWEYMAFCELKEARDITSQRLRVIHFSAQKVLDALKDACRMFASIAKALSLPIPSPTPVLQLPDYARPLAIEGGTVQEQFNRAAKAPIPKKELSGLVKTCGLEDLLDLVCERLSSANEEIVDFVKQPAATHKLADVAFFYAKLGRTIRSLKELDNKLPRGQLSTFLPAYSAWSQAQLAYLETVMKGIPVKSY
jgi:hypothetical protein